MARLMGERELRRHHLTEEQAPRSGSSGSAGFEEDLGELPLDYGNDSALALAADPTRSSSPGTSAPPPWRGPGMGSRRPGPCCACSMGNGWCASWSSCPSRAASTSTGCRRAVPTAWRRTSWGARDARGGIGHSTHPLTLPRTGPLHGHVRALHADASAAWCLSRARLRPRSMKRRLHAPSPEETVEEREYITWRAMPLPGSDEMAAVARVAAGAHPRVRSPESAGPPGRQEHLEIPARPLGSSEQAPPRYWRFRAAAGLLRAAQSPRRGPARGGASEQTHWTPPAVGAGTIGRVTYEPGFSGAGAPRAPAVRAPPRARGLPRGGLALRGDHRDVPAAAAGVRRLRRGRRAVPGDDDAHADARHDAARRAADGRATRAAGPAVRAGRARRCTAPATIPTFAPLARFYRDHFERCAPPSTTLPARPGGRVPAAPGRGHLEIITCCATHGFLPLMQQTPEAVRAQITVAAQPLPADTSAATRAASGWPSAATIPGVEQLLAAEGIRYFFVDTHGLTDATPAPAATASTRRSSPRPGVAAFARDPRAASRCGAPRRLPGRPVYREFYRDIGWDLRLRLHPPVHPAHRRPEEHRLQVLPDHRQDARTRSPTIRTSPRERAADARGQLHVQPREADRAPRRRRWAAATPIVVAPYDAELYGHWWFEGPLFLDFLHPQGRLRPADVRAGHARPTTCASTPRTRWPRRRCAPGARAATRAMWLDASQRLDLPPPAQVRRADGRAGAGLPGRDRPASGARSTRPRASCCWRSPSDWAFIMKTGTMVEYAVRRTKEHVLRFLRLHDQIRAGHHRRRVAVAHRGQATTSSRRSTTGCTARPEPALARRCVSATAALPPQLGKRRPVAVFPRRGGQGLCAWPCSLSVLSGETP